VTHAPALRVHSAVLERLALATIVLIGLSGDCFKRFQWPLLEAFPEVRTARGYADTTDYVVPKDEPAF